MTPIAPTMPLFSATPLPLQTRLPEVGPDTDVTLLAVLREKCGEEVVTSWFGRLQIDKIDVDVFVCKVRRKLKPFGVAIRTIWGVGYAIDEPQRGLLKKALAQDAEAP